MPDLVDPAGMPGNANGQNLMTVKSRGRAKNPPEMPTLERFKK
jgi:hypothetical protein